MPQQTDTPDAELVARTKSDPKDGLHGIYDRYANRLFGYALTITKDRGLAEDAVHDALLAAIGAIERLRDPDRLRPWLFSITRNECHRQLRHRQRNIPPSPVRPSNGEGRRSTWTTTSTATPQHRPYDPLSPA